MEICLLGTEVKVEGGKSGEEGLGLNPSGVVGGGSSGFNF